MRPPRLGAAGALVVAISILPALAASATVSAAPSSGLLGTTPYVHLMTQVNDCSAIKKVNSLTGTALSNEIAQLTRWFVHFHAEDPNNFPLGHGCQGASSTTLAMKLAAAGRMVSNYRNGSQTSQGSFTEAPSLETTAPLDIGTFWPAQYRSGRPAASKVATLTTSLSAAATTVVVSSAAAVRPSGTPSTWPWVASRGSGAIPRAHSANTADFVSWIRVDNELMQLLGAPVGSHKGTVRLSVVRGLWGTAAVSHSTGARVLSPVYAGNNSAKASDQALAGYPGLNNVHRPLRYAIKVWLSAAQQWIATRIKVTFGAGTSGYSGYNAVWLDISSCLTGLTGAPDGSQVIPYDDRSHAVFTDTTGGTAQTAKFAGLRKLLPGLKLLANNLRSDTANSCEDGLLAHVVDGGVLEAWQRVDPVFGSVGTFAGAEAQSFAIQQNNWPAIYWIRWDHDFSGNPAQYQRYAYGSLLLGYRTTATRFQFGGAWNLSRPDDLFFWNWGTPRTNPAGVSTLAVPGTGLYRRDFTNGIIVVNPSSRSTTYNLHATYYDVVHLDSNGNPKRVTSVTVPAHDAGFLLNKL